MDTTTEKPHTKRLPRRYHYLVINKEGKEQKCITREEIADIIGIPYRRMLPRKRIPTDDFIEVSGFRYKSINEPSMKITRPCVYESL